MACTACERRREAMKKYFMAKYSKKKEEKKEPVKNA